MSVLQADLPRLRWLVLGFAIGDDFLTSLAHAKLPLLTDIELRCTELSGEAVHHFNTFDAAFGRFLELRS